MNPDNACTLRITAAAGTELAGAYSSGTRNFPRMDYLFPDKSSLQPRRPSSCTRHVPDHNAKSTAESPPDHNAKSTGEILIAHNALHQNKMCEHVKDKNENTLYLSAWDKDEIITNVQDTGENTLQPNSFIQHESNKSVN